MSTSFAENIEARITDEAVAKLRARLGIPMPDPMPPWYLRPNEGAIRHWATGYGDDNPLWRDEAYAASTRWGGIIAPPGMIGGETTTGLNEVNALAPEHREIMKGDPLRGVHEFRAGGA